MIILSALATLWLYLFNAFVVTLIILGGTFIIAVVWATIEDALKTTRN